MASGASTVMKRNLKLFNGENYLMWKFRLSEQEGASRVLNEDPPEPLTDEWIKWERFARGTLIEYLVDITLSQLPPGRATARQILEKFDGLNACKKVSTQLCVQDRLFNCKLKPDTSMKKHMLEIEEMVRDLTACGLEVNETTKVWYMLNSLPLSYAPIKAAIKTMADDRLTLAFVKGILLEHEEYLARENNDTTKALHFRSTNDKGWKKEKHFLKNKTFKNKQVQKCFHCGRKNHLKRDCFFYKQSLKTYQKPHYQKKKNNHQETSANVSAAVEEPFAFMCTNDSNYEKKESGRFILDSGATEHIINDLGLFTEHRQLAKPICITVAKKGATIEATHIGQVEINTTLGYNGTLKDVLYSSSVPANLISVRRIQEAGMSVVFTETGNVEIKRGSTTMIKALLKLDISHNSITKLPDMGELRKLQIFYAQHNDIQEIPGFCGCEHVQEIYLGNNYIEEIPLDFCDNMNHLKILELRDNQIKIIPAEITKLANLIKFDLTNNDIEELPNTIGLMPHLQSFKIDGNRLKLIRPDIIHAGTNRILRHLKEKISDEDLQALNIPKDVSYDSRIFPDRYTMRNGNFLNLAMKNISKVSEECFIEAKEANVSYVDLCKNKLVDVPAGLQILSSTLTELNLSVNKITMVPEFLMNLTKLKFCDLSGNQLNDLPNCLSNLVYMRELILSNNRFNKIPNCIFQMIGLEILLMNDNSIEEIPIEELKLLKRIATLNLSNNYINFVPPELGNMTQLKSLELNGNPFRQPRYAILQQGTDSILSYLRDKIPL